MADVAAMVVDSAVAATTAVEAMVVARPTVEVMAVASMLCLNDRSSICSSHPRLC